MSVTVTHSFCLKPIQMYAQALSGVGGSPWQPLKASEEPFTGNAEPAPLCHHAFLNTSGHTWSQHISSRCSLSPLTHYLPPALVLHLPLLHAHDGITFPGDQQLNILAVQVLGMLIKLHCNSEIQVIVAECAVGFLS